MDMNRPELNFRPKLQVINEDQIAQIHMAALDVLERTGVKMHLPASSWEIARANGPFFWRATSPGSDPVWIALII